MGQLKNEKRDAKGKNGNGVMEAEKEGGTSETTRNEIKEVEERKNSRKYAAVVEREGNGL